MKPKYHLNKAITKDTTTYESNQELMRLLNHVPKSIEAWIYPSKKIRV